jgi:hypothetical protein
MESLEIHRLGPLRNCKQVLLVPSGAPQSSHESHSFGAGGVDELKIVHESVRLKSRENVPGRRGDVRCFGDCCVGDCLVHFIPCPTFLTERRYAHIVMPGAARSCSYDSFRP